MTTDKDEETRLVLVGPTAFLENHGTGINTPKNYYFHLCAGCSTSGEFVDRSHSLRVPKNSNRSNKSYDTPSSTSILVVLYVRVVERADP